MKTNNEQIVDSHSVFYTFFFMNVFFLVVPLLFIEWNPMFDPTISSMTKDQIGCFEALFMTDTLFAGILGISLSHFFFTIIDFMKKTICRKLFSFSIASQIACIAIYGSIYSIIREMAISSFRDFVFAWIPALIFAPILDIIVHTTKFTEIIPDDTRKRRLKKYYPPKKNVPRDSVSPGIINPCLFMPFLVLITTGILVLLGHLLAKSYPFFDPSIIQADNSIMAVCANQFVYHLVFTGICSLFACKCAQVFDDVILSKENLSREPDFPFGPQDCFVFSAIGLFVSTMLFMLFSLFAFGPISTTKSFLCFITYSLACTLMLDFSASYAFRKICRG